MFTIVCEIPAWNFKSRWTSLKFFPSEFEISAAKSVKKEVDLVLLNKREREVASRTTVTIIAAN